MKQNRSLIVHSAQGSYPLRPVVDVEEIELSKPSHQCPKPQSLLVPPRHWDSTHKLAGAPYPAALVGKWIDIWAVGRKAENRDLDFLGDPAVDFVSPASQSAAVVGAELLPAR